MDGINHFDQLSRAEIGHLKKLLKVEGVDMPRLEWNQKEKDKAEDTGKLPKDVQDVVEEAVHADL